MGSMEARGCRLTVDQWVACALATCIVFIVAEMREHR